MSRFCRVGGLSAILAALALAAAAQETQPAVATQPAAVPAAPLQVEKLKLVKVVGDGPFRHGGRIESIHVLDGGKQILTVGDGIVQWWDAATGKSVRRVSDGPARVQHVAITADRKLAFGLDARYHGVVWDLDTGQVVRRFEQAREALALSPDGKLAVGRGRSGGIGVWEVSNGRLQREYGKFADRNECAIVSPDGRFLAAVGYTMPAVIDRAPGLSRPAARLCFWDLSTEQETGRAERLSMRTRMVGFSPKEPLCISVADDRSAAGVRLWDAATGKERWNSILQPGDSAAAAFSTDGQVVAVAVGREKAAIVLLRVSDGKEQRRLEFPAAGVVCHAVAFTSDGRELLAGAGGWLCRWETASGRRLFPAAEQVAQAPLFTTAPSVLADTQVSATTLWVAPDGRRAYTSNRKGGEVQVWDLERGQCAARWPLGGEIKEMSLSPDGRRLVAAGWGDAMVVDTATGKAVHTLQKTLMDDSGLVWLDEGRKLGAYGQVRSATGQMEDGWLVWDVDGGSVRLVNPGRGPYLLRAVTRGGRLAMTGENEGVRFFDPSTGKDLGTIPLDHGILGGIWVPETGPYLLGMGEPDKLMQWRIPAADRPVDPTVLARWVRELGAADPAVRIAATTRLIEAGSGAAAALAKADPQDAEAQDRARQVREGWQKRLAPTGVCELSVLPIALAFHPDGRHWALLGHDSSEVVLGECTPQGPKVVGKLTDWRRPAALAWSGDGKTLAAVNGDCTISVYRAE